MNQFILSLLAFIGGVFLAVQGGLNAQLGVLLKNPILASLVAFFCSAFFALLFLAVSIKSIPTTTQLAEIPYYLWFMGGLFSLAGISLYYYTIPKLGVSTMISMGLFGQITFSIIAGHYGWFNLPVETINIKKLIGFAVLILGVLLINNK